MTPILTWFWRLGPGNPMVTRIVEGGSRRSQHMLVRMGYLGALVGLVVLGLLSGGGLLADNVSLGTLDIMLTTPMTPRQYVWGKLRGLVRFLGVMIAVPVVTLLGVGAYTLITGWGGAAQAAFTHYETSAGLGGGPGGGVYPGLPLVLPEAGLWLALCLIPFVSLCVAVGMLWSLKARTVLGAVVPTVCLVGAVALVMGLCGWSAAGRVPLVGPAINAFSPATNAVLLVNPWARISGFGGSSEVGRITLGIAAAVAAGVYWSVVYSLIVAMTRNFDQTVRKLSGTG